MTRPIAIAAIVAAGWSLAVPTTPASASPPAGEPARVGDAVIVSSSDGSKELTHGGSATEFSLRLPPGAACPGDSANDQWRVQSFMIPATADPGTLQYNVAGPSAPGQFALFMVNTSPIVDSLTNQNTTPGEPGVIPAVAPLSFAAFPPDVLPPGTYRIGIACTLSRQTANYWDTEVVITASSGDKPSGFVWRLPHEPANVNDTSEGSSTWPFVAGGLLAATLGWFVWRRKTRTRPTTRSPVRTRTPVKTRTSPVKTRTHGETAGRQTVSPSKESQ